MTARLRIENAEAGDRLLWVCGGAVQEKESMLAVWDVTTAGRQKTLARTFSPDECRDNRVTVEGDRFIVQLNASAKNAAVGRCTAASKLTVADADAWSDPLKLLASPLPPAPFPKGEGRKPLACGVANLDGQREIHWAILDVPSSKTASVTALASVPQVFAAGLQRVEEIGQRVVVDTPDPRLNALVAASSAVTDGVFRDGIFTHSGMRWGVPLLGWRTMFGGTVYGWHDRVKTQARSCLAKQITASAKTLPKADVATGLSCQSLDSRLFGKGRVDAHQPWHYDMQTQFFDQLIHAWRWTGDPELEKMLRRRWNCTWSTSTTVSIRTTPACTRATPTPGRPTTSGTTAAAPRRRRPMPTPATWRRWNWPGGPATRRP